MTTDPGFDPYAVLQVVPGCEQVVIHGAYRALALKYHPDHDATNRAAEKMAALNRAYAILRDEAGRAAFDRSRRRTVAGVSVSASTMRPGAPPPPDANGGSVLDFGRYAGWSLRELARRDPDYLLWLSRHSSGIRYRKEIYAILRESGRTAA